MPPCIDAPRGRDVPRAADCDRLAWTEPPSVIGAPYPHRYPAAMAERSSQSITIDAPASQVMGVIADFGRYPEWARSVRSAQVVTAGNDGRAREVRFVMDAGPIKDDYTLVYEWSAGDRAVNWRLVEPSQVQKSQEGSYELVERGGSTVVTYTLAVETSMPMLGMLKRKGERIIMDTALKELKRRVEGEP